MRQDNSFEYDVVEGSRHSHNSLEASSYHPEIVSKEVENKNRRISFCNKTIVSKYFKALIPIFLLLLFNILYLYSLEGCQKEIREKCFIWFKSNIVKLVGFDILSTLVLFIFIVCIYKQTFDAKWSILLLVNLAVFAVYDHDTTFVSHGLFNFVIMMVAITSAFILILSVKLIVLIRKKGIKGVLIACTILAMLAFYIYFTYIYGSCDGWERGIGETKLQNLENECVIVKPNYCELSIRDGWFDLNRITQECAKRKMIFMKKYLNSKLQNRSNIKRIGYPRVENSPYKAKYNDTYFKEIYGKEYIDMDDPEVSQNIKDNIEFILDISNSDSHILHVELKKNQARAEEAKKLRKKILEDDKAKGFNERIDKDVLIIYFDNISRANFHLKMKKMNKYFSQFTGDSHESSSKISSNLKDNNNIYSTKSMKSFEYFKYS